MKIYNSVSFVCHVPEFAVKDNGINTMATKGKVTTVKMN